MPELTDELKAGLKAGLDELKGMLEGSATDVAAALEEISALAITAAATGRTDLLEEIWGQARTVMERQRVRAIEGQWRFVKVAFNGVISTVVKASIAGL